MSERYTKGFRVQVAKEASQPGFKDLEHVIAEKYGLRKSTVERWRDVYLEQGEKGLKKGALKCEGKTAREKELEKENAELKEEIRILKKAAAFLADLRRE